MRLLTAADIRRAVPMREAIAAVKSAFAQLSSGQATVPVRTGISAQAHRGTALYMPAYLPASQTLGVKAVSVYPGNRDHGIPTIFAAVLLQDAATGQPSALLEGTYLTALRTGAATGAATDVLARPEASRLGLFGTGGQAPTQLEGVCAVRPITTVWVYSRNPANAKVFIERMRRLPFAQGIHFQIASTAREAVHLAEIIVTATTARAPLFAADEIREGTHVNAIGAFTPEMQEVAPELVVRAKLVVDSREACLAEAGDILIPIHQGLISPAHIYAELGELVAGRRPGRESAAEITLFKSVGNAVQDLGVGKLALERAEREGFGQVVDLI
ncbi:MAG: ornithine cyclodeaminase [Nitrospinae bacterium]|nr:ornithine cyclodeaminase [Nitrospinota bacterium]